jgi:hypothetical protein
LRGELSKVSTSKGIGEDIFIWALTSPKSAKARTPWKLKLKSMVVRVVVRMVVIGGMSVGALSKN